jgi:phosphonate transport system substrate-binding protein
VALVVALCISSALWAGDGLVLAVHPYKSSSDLIKNFSPLADYLGQKLSIDMRLNISKDYQSHIDLIGSNQVDIAYLGPASYVLLVKKYGQKPILMRQVIQGKAFFQGKIIARKNSPITTLGELAGKRFAFGDPSSTMSHLVPRYMLIEAGVGADKLSEYKFLGSHDNVAMGVLVGDYDAGAVKEAVFYKYKSRGLKVLATTPSIPEHLFVVRSDLPVSTIKALKKALIELNDSQDGHQILVKIKKSITALQPAKDADYDGLRNILAVLAEKGVIQ